MIPPNAWICHARWYAEEALADRLASAIRDAPPSLYDALRYGRELPEAEVKAFWERFHWPLGEHPLGVPPL